MIASVKRIPDGDKLQSRLRLMCHHHPMCLSTYHSFKVAQHLFVFSGMLTWLVLDGGSKWPLWLLSWRTRCFSYQCTNMLWIQVILKKKKDWLFLESSFFLCSFLSLTPFLFRHMKQSLCYTVWDRMAQTITKMKHCIFKTHGVSDGDKRQETPNPKR